jgi:N-acetyltransferase
MHIEPVTLEGTHVRLAPLSLSHQEGLSAVGLDEEIWRWSPMPSTLSEALKRDKLRRACA